MSTLGQVIKQEKLDKLFYTGPGEDLVPKTLMQMAKVPGFVALFGQYKEKCDQQRWADYQRSDWSSRQLPAINIFEGQTETKESDNAYLKGTITFQIFWPASARRGDSRRFEAAFKGAFENFFASHYVKSMLDELYFIQRPEKVYGLNEYGKNINWEPNTEGLIGTELVPVSVLNVGYRIDLRSWYRALEHEGRTKDRPFEKYLEDLKFIGGETSFYDAEVAGQIQTQIAVEIPVNQN